MSPLPSSVLDAFEYHDGQHDQETDPDHDGKGEEVGVDVEGGVISEPDHELLPPRVVGVVPDEAGGVSVADEHAGYNIVTSPAHGDEVITLVVINDGSTVICPHGILHFVLKCALSLLGHRLRPPEKETDGRF